MPGEYPAIFFVAEMIGSERETGIKNDSYGQFRVVLVTFRVIYQFTASNWMKTPIFAPLKNNSGEKTSWNNMFRLHIFLPDQPLNP
jgi:hypothetical protein